MGGLILYGACNGVPAGVVRNVPNPARAIGRLYSSAVWSRDFVSEDIRLARSPSKLVVS